jgi:predicted transcriptional regulator
MADVKMTTRRAIAKSPAADKTVIKMSVNLSPEVVDALKQLATKRNTTMTEVLRQAIGTEKFLDEVSEDQGTVLVEDKKGRVRQLVFR